VFLLCVYYRSGGGGGGEADAGGWRNRVLSTFLNELDGISGGGGGAGRAGELPGSEGAFLFGDSDIDCQSDLEGEDGAGGDTLLVLAACQDVSLIDEALLRPGRLHYHVALGLPDRTSVYDILRVKLRHVQLAASMDPASAHHGAAGHKVLLDHFADELMRHAPTPADVDSLCHRAVLLAIKDSAAAGGEVTVAVTANHLQLAVRELWG
jgi:SpoVK/Ycf46/Vps4 family AAA+-type ATPase